MVRGRVFCITKDNVLYTVEFNGGMYIESDSNGEEMFDMLKDCETESDFLSGIWEFNKNHFKYKADTAEDLYGRLDIQDIDIKQIRKEFISLSDYYYILNLSGVKQEIKDRDGMTLSLEHGCVGVLCYGSYDSGIKESEFKIVEGTYERIMQSGWIDITREDADEIDELGLNADSVFVDYTELADYILEEEDIPEYIKDFVNKEALGESISQDSLYYVLSSGHIAGLR